MGAAPPYAFRRLTQEHAVAMTVGLFEGDDGFPAAVEVNASNCDALVRVLERAGAVALLPNFVAAEFNDNDGACSCSRAKCGRWGGAVARWL